MSYDDNPQLRLAYNFVQFTNRNVFLTGRAGTGKTTFLKKLRTESPKRMVVLAPTGVAAINAGGMTLHSFFQLPFGLNIPGYKRAEEENRFTKRKIDIIRTLDLLVIDEISMVRADLLDAIDETLQRYRRNSLPFGGVQLLLIGDLQQLSPVVRDDEWAQLRDYYDTAFFFSSRALQRTNYVTVELQRIYRQENQHFVDILNQIRTNTVDNDTMQELNGLYNPAFMPNDNEGYITLTTHNNQADQINQTKLKELKTKQFEFEAKIQGVFPSHMFPTEEKLILKEGAQVMFVKNDPSAEKLFFNGKIGRIVNIEDEKIYVECNSDKKMIEVEPLEWNNSRYEIDNETKEITEVIDGVFSQYPLRLAWAITVHKSQGLTFDKVVIDAEKSFSHGQVYVAMSRCRTLEGIVLRSPINNRCIINDPQVRAFNRWVEENPVSEHDLQVSKNDFECELIRDLFSFEQIQKCMRLLNNSISKYKSRLIVDVSGQTNSALMALNTEVCSVSEKFQNQVKFMYMTATANNSEIDRQALQTRMTNGVGYFLDKLKAIITPILTLDVSADNKEIGNEMQMHLLDLSQNYKEKVFCLKKMSEQFDVQEYMKARAMSKLEAENKPKTENKKPTAKSSNLNIVNAELFELLRSWRKETSEETGAPLYVIATQDSLVEVAEKLPTTVDELQRIKGFGAVKVKRFGYKIVEIVKRYMQENGIKGAPLQLSLMDASVSFKPKKSAKEKEKVADIEKFDTHEATMRLFLDGNDVDQIAKKRNLTISTIIGHLCHYISEGSIDPEDVIDVEVVEKILANLQKNGLRPLSDIKKNLPEFTFDEIRLVVSYYKREYAAEND